MSDWDAYQALVDEFDATVVEEIPHAPALERALSHAQEPPAVVVGNGRGEARPRTPLERFRAAIVVGDRIMELPRPAPLIDGVLDLDSTAVLFGRAGIGKSFVALDWALSVATGSWWLGREVEAGSVLYIAAEGASGLGIRVEAWRQQRETWTTGDLALLPIAVNLLHGPDAEALVTLAAELEPRFVIADTLPRCMAGGDENSARDMGAAVNRLDQIRQATGACVLAVHHSGKDRTAGMRGSSALEGALDTAIEATGDPAHLKLRDVKQKNHEATGVLAHLRLVTVGDSATIDEHRAGDDTAMLTTNDQTALEALAAIEIPGGVPYGEWKRTALAAGVPDGSFARCRRRLLDANAITTSGTERQPRYSTAGIGITGSVTGDQ